MKFILNFIKKQPVIVFFFLLLFICLFIGDGKQTVTDYVGAVGVLLLLAITIIRGVKPIHNKILTLWGFLLVYLIIRTVFSDEVGYSVNGLIRYIEAFCVYYIFSQQSQKDGSRLFVKTFLVFAIISLGISIIFSFNPRFAAFLPSMNLLYPTYGHNRIVDLLIIAFVFSLIQYSQTKNMKYLLLLLLFVIWTFFSFARAVLLLEAISSIAIFIYIYILKKQTPSHLIPPILFVVMVAFVSIIILPLDIGKTLHIFPAYNKLPAPQDGRLEYWRQALQVVSENPFFGYGPGTFSLESLRVQRLPHTNSWFAHNYVLETWSEIGFIGIVLIFLLVFGLVQIGQNKFKNIYWYELLFGIGVVLTESFVDYNMNYLSIWLIVWASMGVLFPAIKQGNKNNTKLLLIVAVILLSVFVLIQTILYIFIKNEKYTKTQFIFCVYDVNCIKSFISQSTKNKIYISNNQKKVIYYLHKTNGAVLLEMARYEMKKGSKNESYLLYIKIIERDPKNNPNIQEYAEFLLKEGENEKLFELFKQILKATPNFVTEYFDIIMQNKNEISLCLNQQTLIAPGKDMIHIYHAKVTYYISLCLYKLGYQESSKDLMKIAVNADTWWSNIYVDYSAMSVYQFNDVSTAKKVLEMCKRNNYSYKHCSYYDSNPLPISSTTASDVTF